MYPVLCDEDEEMVTCPACSGEGCSEYARAVDAGNRCDGEGEVSTSKRHVMILRDRINRLARQGIYKR